MLENVRIVLVRPIRSGNVGAAARIMRNMGIDDLVLVAPACDHLDDQGEGFAMRAKDLLENARIVPDIETALADCAKTFATTGKAGLYRRQAAATPREAAPQALDVAASGGRVAIAFGPEDRGLIKEEILLFDEVIEIPGNPAYPVLNLASAVVVLCYELREAWRAREGVTLEKPYHDPAPDERKRVMFEKLFTALDEIGFFAMQQKPEHLRYLLRRVLGRSVMSINEVDVIIGMAQQMRWYVRNHPQKDQAQ